MSCLSSPSLLFLLNISMEAVEKADVGVAKMKGGMCTRRQTSAADGRWIAGVLHWLKLKFSLAPLYITLSDRPRWSNNNNSTLKRELKAWLCPDSGVKCSVAVRSKREGIQSVNDCSHCLPGPSGEPIGCGKTHMLSDCVARSISTPTEWNGGWPDRVIDRGRCWYELMPAYSDLLTRVWIACEQLSAGSSHLNHKNVKIFYSVENKWVISADCFWLDAF